MNKINVSNLRTYENEFLEEKGDFNSNAYNVFTSSYISSSSNSYVSGMKMKLSSLYNLIKYAYTNIDNWWSNYLSEVEALENSLSGDSSTSSISDPSLRNYVNNHLKELLDYYVNDNYEKIEYVRIETDPEIVASIYQEDFSNAETYLYNKYNNDTSHLQPIEYYNVNIEPPVYPVKEFNEEEWLASLSSFSPVNHREKVSYTIINGFVSLTEGIAKVPENLMDAVIMQNVHDSVERGFNYRYHIKEDGTIDWENPILVLSDFEQKMVDFVKKEHVKGAYDGYYATAGQELYTNSYAPDMVRLMGNEIGYYTAVAATGAVTAPAVPALALSAGMGKYQEQALNNGADVESAYNYAAGRATWDAVEMVLGQKISKLDLFNTKLFAKYNYISAAQKQLINTGAHVVLDSLDAATATYVDPYLQMQYMNEETKKAALSYYNVDNPLSRYYGKTWEDLTFEEKYKAMYEYNGGNKTLLFNMGIGAGVSALTEVPDIMNSFKSNDIATSIDSLIDVKNATKDFDVNEQNLIDVDTAVKDSKVKIDNIETFDSEVSSFITFVDSLSDNELKEFLESAEGKKILDSIGATELYHIKDAVDGIDAKHIIDEEIMQLSKKSIEDIDVRLLYLYDKAKTSGLDLPFFLGFEEHNFVHVKRVADETINVSLEINKLIDNFAIEGYAKVDLDVLYKAGLAHDLGMQQGGYVLFKDGTFELIDKVVSNPSEYAEQLKDIFDVETIDDIFDMKGQLVRKYHPLNSAIIVSQNAEIFGDNKEMIACLTLIHSKSTSGVGNIDSYSQLSSMVKRLYENQSYGDLNIYDFDVSKLVEVDNSGIPIVNDNGDYIFKEGVAEEFRTGAVALRAGDAHAYKTGYNHGGGEIVIVEYPDVAKTLDSELTLKELCKLEGNQAKVDIVYEDNVQSLAGGTYEYSKAIVLGESNSFVKQTVAEGNTLTYVHNVKTGECPASTWKFGIEEKFGEYRTYQGINQKVVIELPRDSSDSLLMFYKEQADNYMKENKWLSIDIKIID